MFGVKQLTTRLEEAEARILGLVALAREQQSVNTAIGETQTRMAGAIDEVERRQNNALHATNAVYVALTKRVEMVAVETVQALQAITKTSATARDGEEAPAGQHPPAVADAAPEVAAATQDEVGCVATSIALGRIADLARADG